MNSDRPNQIALRRDMGIRDMGGRRKFAFNRDLLTNLSFSLFIYLLYLFISFYKMLLKILSTPLLHDLKILSHYCLLRYTLSTLHLQYTVPLACVRASCLFHASRHRCSVRNRDHATGSSTQRLSTLCLRCMIRTKAAIAAVEHAAVLLHSIIVQ